MTDRRRVVVTGDLNIAHTRDDLRNWKGNLGKAGFLPAERAYLDGWLGSGEWVDVSRRAAGEVEGPYTWWSWRGKAFDNDTGWRIDYQLAPLHLAQIPHNLRDDCGVAKETGLDRRHRKIRQQQLDLFMHDFRIGRLNS